MITPWSESRTTTASTGRGPSPRSSTDVSPAEDQRVQRALLRRVGQPVGTGGDRLQVWDAANASQLPFGLVRLFRTDYVTVDVTLSASTMVMTGSTITVTLGSPSETTAAAAGTGDATWAPTESITDRAGNACSTAAATESGAADAEF